MIMDTLGALALATEPPTVELMRRAPVLKKGNFISKVMWRNILGQSFYQFVVIWYLQARGAAIFNLDGPDAGLILNTLIFNSFVFCQVFNEVSSREMQKINVFKGILSNYVFVSVLGCTVLFQIIIVEFLGTFANTSPLTLQQWYFSVLVGFIGMPTSPLTLQQWYFSVLVGFIGLPTSPLTLQQWYFSVLVGFIGIPIAAILKMIPV